jgi:ubiquinone biosynthesis protein
MSANVRWENLIDEHALALLLPDDYAHFARPVKESLVVFLSGLPESSQATILAEQAALPLSATVSERLGLLASGCPVLHKLGQVLARDRRLAPELRQQLRKLESMPPTVPLKAIEAILSQELGSLERRGITLLPPAIAEASVAVVIPFREIGDHLPHGGVFKILKPGIEERLALELELLGRVGSHLDERCVELRLPQVDYQSAFAQVRDKLCCEVQLDLEQRQLTEAKAFYAGEPDVQIPRLLDHCTARVTAMERVMGDKVTDHTLTISREKTRLANLVTRALITRPIFSRDRQALFHSDPHAGNLLYTTDGRLAILDWSLVGFLGEQERSAMIQIMLAAVTLNKGRIVTELESLAEQSCVDRIALSNVVDNWLRRIRRGHFPGLCWLVGMLDEATQTAGLRVVADLMLFRKSLLTLEGVIGELGADDFPIDQVVFEEFARHFGQEWPERWISFPDSREYATRLSNTDLAETLLGAPLAVARFWQAEFTDMLTKRRPPRETWTSSSFNASTVVTGGSCR